mgnify:CR=1 FL=1
MAYNNEKKSFMLFVKLFLVLFIILFLLPELVDGVLNMFLTYQQPRGTSILVSKSLYEDMLFGDKFLLILKNIIISL